MQGMQVCTRMDVATVSQCCGRRRYTESCAPAQVKLNVSAVTVCIHTRPKLACTCEISSKTAILSGMWLEDNLRRAPQLIGTLGENMGVN